MEPEAMIPWLEEQAKKLGWRELSIEIGGADEDTVYGWWRRGRVPKWRREAVKQAAERLARKQAA